MNKKNKVICIATFVIILVCVLAAVIWFIVDKKPDSNNEQQTTAPYEQSQKNANVESANDSKSAYELAVNYGFDGTEKQWIDSLNEKKGDNNANIASAYISDASHLVVVFDDGVKVDTGYVSPKNASANNFTVLFKDFDGTVLKTQTVNKGENATAPESPTREGYIFTGWDNIFTDIQNNTIVTAQYVEESNQPVIYIDNVTASAGDTVTVNAFIKNNSGILGTSLVVNYNSDALTLIKADAGDAFSALNVTKPAKFKDGCIFPCYAEKLNDGDVKDGTVLVLTFKVSKEASEGSYTVSVSCPDGDTFDKDNNVINVMSSPGSITIK